jgi:hypothetical protein
MTTTTHAAISSAARTCANIAHIAILTMDSRLRSSCG